MLLIIYPIMFRRYTQLFRTNEVFSTKARNRIHYAYIVPLCSIRYTPYFFDKSMLDNILEEAVDQHFHTLIQIRHMQRRRDVVDDNLAAEVIEEMGDSLGDPPEVWLNFKHFIRLMKY